MGPTKNSILARRRLPLGLETRPPSRQVSVGDAAVDGIRRKMSASRIPFTRMTQQVTVTLIDDLDGSPAEETIVFALDGASYEIDLNAKNSAALRKALDKFLGAARRQTGQSGARRSRSSSSLAARSADIDPKAVRAWAQQEGLEISSRGRIPADIIGRYRATGRA